MKPYFLLYFFYFHFFPSHNIKPSSCLPTFVHLHVSIQRQCEKGSDTEYSVFIKKLYLLRVQSSEDRTYIYRVIPIYKYPH